MKKRFETKSGYFEATINRTNPIKKLIVGGLLLITAFPKVIIEVIVRKNFGVHYLTAFSVGIIFIIFAALPMVMGMRIGSANSLWRYIELMPLYYSFLFAFLIMGIKHLKDNWLPPGVYIADRSGTCSGDIHPIFYKIARAIGIKNRTTRIRIITIWLEPLPFLLAGLIIAGFDHALGFLLIFAALSYSGGNWASCMIADDYVIGEIGRQVRTKALAEWVMNSDSDDDKVSETGGNKFTAHLPEDPEARLKLLKTFMGSDEGDMVS